MEPIEANSSGVNHAVLHAQNNRFYLGPIETLYYCAKHAVMCAQNHR